MTSAFSSEAPRSDRIRVEEQRGAPPVLASAIEAGADEAAITTVAGAPPPRLGRALHAGERALFSRGIWAALAMRAIIATS
jgi:hypothetical protein